jgi:hypothetical protein
MAKKSSILFYFSNIKTLNEYNELFPYKELKFITDSNILELNSSNYYDRGKIFKLTKLTFSVVVLLYRINQYYRRHASLLFYLQSKNFFSHTSFREKNIEYISSHKQKLNLIKISLIRLLSNSFGIWFTSQILSLLYLVERRRFKYYVSEDISMIILPYTGGISPEWDFLVWYGNRCGIYTIGIQENWDNLSSKIFLIHKPRAFATWGKQSSSHLRVLHSYSGETSEVGCLRIQRYYDLRVTNCLSKSTSSSAISNKNSLKIILVIGTGNPLMDLNLIESINSYMNFNPGVSDLRLKFIYRSHPNLINSEGAHEIFRLISSYEFIDILNPVLGEENNVRIDLIERSSCVISFYSTVILEASILNKFCIIPDFLDPNFGARKYHYLDDLSHYSSVSLLTNIRIANSVKELFELLSNKELDKTLMLNDENLLNWFCRNSPNSYHLLNFLKACFYSL